MKTRLDIYNSAHAAAAAALSLPNNYEVQEQALNTFNAEKHDPLDYDQWSQTFNERRLIMAQLSKLPAVSAQAASAAAAAAAPAAARPMGT